MSGTVLKQLDEHGVLTLTLNRPDRKNAFNREQWQAFSDAIAEAGEDRRVACVLVTGAGGNFSSGTDLTDPDNATAKDEHPFRVCAERLSLFEKPLIGAATGVAIGGGATLLLHCDVLYVGESLRFRFPFTALGVVPEFASSYLLPLNIGMRRASELMLSSEWVDAARAVEYGIATRAFGDDQVLEQALTKAREIAQWPTGSLVATKRLMRMAHAEAMISVLRAEVKALEKQFLSEETGEALAAFIERRKPDFSRFRQ